MRNAECGMRNVKPAIAPAVGGGWVLQHVDCTTARVLQQETGPWRSDFRCKTSAGAQRACCKTSSGKFASAALWRHALLLCGLVLTGCSVEEPAAVAVVGDRETNESPVSETELPVVASRAPDPVAQREDSTAPRDRRPLPERTFEDLLNSPDSQPEALAFGGRDFGHPQHDDASLERAGFRKIAGERLNVYTDLPRGDVDDYPRLFALAIAFWKEYFDLPDDKLRDWRMTVYVIKDRQLARRQGLIPADLPAFAHGYQRGFEMWVYDQPSDYYRRHLLLHEGTHGVMNTLLGGAGPPWYMEGVAELLATHHWDGEKLTMRFNPRDKELVPYWGRVKIVRDDFAANRGMTLSDVMNYDNRAHQDVAAYAWCWAACMFLDSHPQTQAAFRKMQSQVRLPGADFNRRLLEASADDWKRVAHEQWFLYVQDMDYGSDPRAAIVEYADGSPLRSEGTVVEVDSQPGWQSSGIKAEAGT